MSWGLKITILYAGFVALIVCMVILSMRQKVDLVSKDYYAQELAFQEKIDLVNHTSTLQHALSWKFGKDSMSLQFPHQFKGRRVSASIFFFRSSDAAMDTRLEIPPDTALDRTFSIGALKQGFYKMQVNWKAGDERFYNEGIIKIR